ncbi:unnamed protein product [Phyllotreta striolata]|uniref:Sulfhydryl oxidase n=1 Tax=Phyllotreta striolata TaxID=444603 RepID=A0A9P0DSL8_PHYSR|nr:unnamed protein product [Phyllotreta striolata]
MGPFVLLFLVLINFSSSAVLNYYRVNNEAGLYSPDDDVTILTISNFNSSIYRSDRAWMVEFYSNWCGFCQRAAPKYKAFASDVKGWKDLIVIAALDCANERNGPVCEYFGITRYPTFRYIHENYVEGPQNTGLPIVADSHTNHTEHRRNLIEIMRIEKAQGRGKQFPNLEPFNEQDAARIFDKNQKIGFLIIQEPLDPVGASIILDFHKVNEAIIRYSYNNLSFITADSLPALFQVEPNGNLHPLNLTVGNRLEIRNIIRDILLARDIEVPVETLRNVSTSNASNQPITSTKEDIELRNKIKKLGDVVFQLDLENAIRYSLKREIGGNADIKGEKLSALRNFVDVLVKYFPTNKKGRCLLRQIRHYANNTDAANGTEIAQWVKEAEDAGDVFSEPPHWLGCKGSSPTKRGFPCGMWKLFHYLTVNAAFDPKQSRDANPRMVLEAMHGYIRNFFGCEDCSNHFQAMAQRRQLFKVLSWEESVLWLWRAHNEVNERLSGDITEDPEFPKVQFPPRANCEKCWKSDGAPDEVEVLSYLKRMYAKENINYLGVKDPSFAAFNMEPRPVEGKSTSGAATVVGINVALLFGFVISMLLVVSY